MSQFWDPSFAFLASVLLAPVFIASDDAARTLSLRPLDEIPSLLFSHFTDPAAFAGLAVFILSWLLATRTGKGLAKDLTPSEVKVRNWYLWNAIVCHVMLDGLTGGNWANALMNAYYRKLDNRFNWDISVSDGGPHEGDVANAFMITQIELYFHSVFCIAAFVGVAQRTMWRHEMELLALSFQVFGAFMFVGGEFLTECKNMVPIGEPGCLPEVNWYTAFFYYFGVGANAIWVVVPALMAYSAVKSSVREKTQATATSRLESKKQS